MHRLACYANTEHLDLTG